MRRWLQDAATGLRLAVRGLWSRRSTTLIVLVLSVVASAASVVAPLYSRAAEESIVRDALLETDAYSQGVHVARPQGDGTEVVEPHQKAGFVVSTLRKDLAHPAFGPPRVARQARGTYHPTRGPVRGSLVNGKVVERPGACAHLALHAGRCPRRPDEALMSRRSLALVGAAVGDRLPVELTELVSLHPGAAAPTLRLTVVGSFDPVSVQDAYWAGQPYFSDFFRDARTKEGGRVLVPPVADPVFLAPGTAQAARITGYTVDVPVLTTRVHLDAVPLLTAASRRAVTDLSLYDLAAVTQLPAALEQAGRGRDLVRIASPLAVAQLVLLAWWTLFLVVGSATEERSPELGLAKLRGLSQGQTGRFGLAEVCLLLLLAAPLGALLGYLAMVAAGPHVFAPGTQVVLTLAVLLTVTLALSGGVVTAAVAARRVFRRPVADLLRRVPTRTGGRRGSVLEGVVVALAVAATVQLVSDRGRRPSPVALLAPGMVAVVGGLLAGRLLGVVARNRVRQARDGGKTARLVAWSGVARRPGTARIASVLAVATCLLLVGVEAWAVAERNRAERASAEVGAAVVLHVRTTDSRHLLNAVRGADPQGRLAMAAVQVSTSNQQDRVLAVDSSRADRVLRWGSPQARPPRPVREIVSPPVAPSLILRPGALQITADVRSVSSPSPMTLGVRLDRAGTPVTLLMGELSPGRHTYRVRVPGRCEPGCRLAALSLAHPITDLGTASVAISVRGISAGPAAAERPLPVGFRLPASWHPETPTLGGPEVRLHAGPALDVVATVPGGPPAEVVRGDVPGLLPAYAGAGAGRDPSEPGSVPTVTSTGLSGADTRFRVVRAGPYVPGAGRAAVLVDLELALRQSATAPAGEGQVWLSRDDTAAERALRHALRTAGVRVLSRDTERRVERGYAGDGAVLALRLLLVCGTTAVIVSVGALLVAAYVGRRQRAYEVAALRAVGLSRRTVRALLLRENLGTVLVALGCGAVASLVASWAVLPSLPQFDTPSDSIAVRYAPDAASGWAAVAGLALVLVAVGLAVATLQLRAGHSDRLREGVR